MTENSLGKFKMGRVVCGEDDSKRQYGLKRGGGSVSLPQVPPWRGENQLVSLAYSYSKFQSKRLRYFHNTLDIKCNLDIRYNPHN
jgi:hypothetical protein